MEHKKIIVKILLAAIFAFGVGYAFVNPLQFGICRSTYDQGAGCLDDTDETIGAPLIFFSIVTAVSLFILYFLREEIFHVWWRFARWYLGIVGALLLYGLLFPHYNSSYLGSAYGGDEFFPIFSAILFFLIFLGIIITKWRKLRRK